jgi:hypothetical protein
MGFLLDQNTVLASAVENKRIYAYPVERHGTALASVKLDVVVLCDAGNPPNVA